MTEYSDIIERYEPGLHNIFGFVDGVYFKMDEPADRNEQNAYYNVWRGMTSLTNVIVFGPDGCILWSTFNAPGSWHDAKVAWRLYDKLLDTTQTPSGFALVADSAFPSKEAMRDKIIVPPKAREIQQEGQAMIDQHINSPNADSVRAVVRARQAVEWGMHTLQSHSHV
jgi:hypothetical protein